MSAVAVLIWVGRLLFLAIFYYFIFNVYRTLAKGHVPQPGREPAVADDPLPQREGRLVLLATAEDATVWVEEPGGKERRLGEGAGVPVGERLSVGRGKGNDVRILDPHISLHHFVIHRRESGYALEDLETTNGTRVDGVKVRGSVPLRAGSRIDVGAVRFRFEVT